MARPSDLAGALRELRSSPRPSPEGVHDLHRALRVERLIQESSGIGRGPSPTGFPRAVRELERSLGALRDLDLFRAVLASAAPRLPTAAERSWRAGVLRDAEIDEGRAEAEVRILAYRCLRSRSTMRRLGPAQGRRAEPPEPAIKKVRRARRRLRDTLRRARRRLSPGRAHAVRKQLRAALLAPPLSVGAPGSRRSGRVRELVADLGRLHDLDVAIERVDRSPRRGRARWRDRLLRQRAGLGRRVRRALSAPSLDRLLD